MLEGRWTTLDLDGTTLAIGGTSAAVGAGLSTAHDVPAADFRILLSHSPDLFYKAQRWGVDLMLSGHNHGGQIRLPLVGPVFMPSRYSRRFDRGFFRQGDAPVRQRGGGRQDTRFGTGVRRKSAGWCCTLRRGRRTERCRRAVPALQGQAPRGGENEEDRTEIETQD